MKLEVIFDGMSLRQSLFATFGPKTGARMYGRIVERIGEEPDPEELGHGQWGVVWPLPSGRALKVTGDATELPVMQKLTKVSHPNLVKVDAVFVVASGRRGVGVIVREQVHETFDNAAPSEVIIDLNMAMDRADDYYRNRMDLGDSDEEAALNSMKWLERSLRMRARSGTARKLLEGVVAASVKLRELGIYTIDLHEGNIGINDPGTPQARAVVFDIGVASTGKADVPIVRNPSGIRVE
jgi:hypothetical protein